MIDDPDAIHGPRLEALHDVVGFERATGISFDTHGTKGMVVFYSKEGVDVDLLSTVANEMYLRRTASSIGSVLAMRRVTPCVCLLSEANTKTIHSVPTLTVEIASVDPTSGEGKRLSHVHCENARDRAKAWVQKLRGGGSQIPPGMPFVETLWTMLGVFMGLLTVSSIYRLFQWITKEDIYLIPLGPFQIHYRPAAWSGVRLGSDEPLLGAPPPPLRTKLLPTRRTATRPTTEARRWPMRLSSSFARRARGWSSSA